MKVPFGTTPEKLNDNKAASERFEQTKQSFGNSASAHLSLGKGTSSTGVPSIQSTKQSKKVSESLMPNKISTRIVPQSSVNENGKEGVGSNQDLGGNLRLGNKESHVMKGNNDDKSMFSFGKVQPTFSDKTSTTALLKTESSGNMLNQSTEKVDFSMKKSPSVKLDYHALLTTFYKKYNSSKIQEIPKTLERYKVGCMNQYNISFFLACHSKSCIIDLFRGEKLKCLLN